MLNLNIERYADPVSIEHSSTLCGTYPAQVRTVLEDVFHALVNLDAAKAVSILEKQRPVQSDSPYLRFFQALSYAELFRFSQAQEILNELVDQCPDSHLTHLALAAINVGRDRLKEASHHLEQLPADSSLRSHAISIEVRIAYARADLDGALAIIEKVDEQANHGGSLLALKAIVLSEKGRLEDANNIERELQSTSLFINDSAPRSSAELKSPRELLTQLSAFLKARSYDKTRSTIQNIIEAHPGLPLSYLIAYGASMDMNDYAEAANHLKKLASLAPEHPRLELLAGRLARSQGKFDESLQHYLNYQQTSAEHRLAYEEMGEALMESGEYRKALTFYDQALRILPKNYFLTIRKAKAYRELGFDEDALSWYDRAIKLLPDRSLAFRGKASTYVGLHRYEDALKHYEISLEKRPDNIEGLTGLSKSLRHLDRYEEAIVHAQRAVQLRPHSMMSNIELAIAHYKLGDKETASNICDKIPDHIAMSYFRKLNLSYCLENIGHPDHALTLVEQLHTQSPTVLSLSTLAHLYRINKDYENARKAFEELIKIADGDIQSRIEYGELLNEMEHYDSAVKQYQAITKQVGDRPNLWHWLGHSLLKSGRSPEALEAYKTAASLAPSDYNKALLVASLLEENGRLDEVNDWLERLLDLDGRQPRSLLYLVKYHHRSKQYEESLAYAEEGLQIEPDHEQLLKLAASASERLGDEKKKLRFAKHLHHLGLAETHHLDWLGQFFARTKRYSDAEKVFQQAIGMSVKKQQLMSNLGYTYYLRGRYKKALSQYETALAEPPQNRGIVLYNKALALRKLSRYEEAKKAFELAKDAGYPPR